MDAAWDGGASADLELAFVAADMAEEDSVIAYLRLRRLLAVVIEATRRAESAERLEAALRLSR
jgi:hypothetical protein